MQKRIAITAGEPAGIGPDLIVMLAQQAWPVELCVIADPDLLQQRAAQLGLPLKIQLIDNKNFPQNSVAGKISVLPIALDEKAIAGELNANNSRYVLKTLETAAQLCLDQDCQALVTAPVHKGIINQAGLVFQGHTEFFADLSHIPKVVMMLATPGLRVALATTHLPLANVPAAITPENIAQSLRILHQDLQQKFSIKQPRIFVAGLNPHAGENGYLGREEIDIIEPVIEQLQAEGLALSGPYAADTLFTEKMLSQCDAVLAMYHDQGLPVLKHKGFGQAVNITLGLPFIRTSVDHGTALDLAGSGDIDTGSLHYALQVAIDLLND